MVPITSNVARVFAFQVALPAELTGLRVDSKAQAEQVRSVSGEMFEGSTSLSEANPSNSACGS